MSLVSWGGFPSSSVVKKPSASAGDVNSTPGLGRSPGRQDGNLLQYSFLENPMYRVAWEVGVATVYGVTKSQTRLSNWAQSLWESHWLFFPSWLRTLTWQWNPPELSTGGGQKMFYWLGSPGRVPEPCEGLAQILVIGQGETLGEGAPLNDWPYF